MRIIEPEYYECYKCGIGVRFDAVEFIDIGYGVCRVYCPECARVDFIARCEVERHV